MKKNNGWRREKIRTEFLDKKWMNETGIPDLFILFTQC
ncbi:MAG: hypothetical protein MRECE_1c092 [Mycoplasmataceae bacterium CE_OT135]|nr:MAG: hypothetical protein MRECE_1c074 [Mycoplasmataceae bacterium CE_OT135]KLL04334.1 MAG: hypothetical protein MRECE_1c092 [Mycoplasmataceae bacterium CE_OT135]